VPSLARCIYPWSEVISSRDLLAPPGHQRPGGLSHARTSPTSRSLRGPLRVTASNKVVWLRLLLLAALTQEIDAELIAIHPAHLAATIGEPR
jgi:hypothetical protein